MKLETLVKQRGRIELREASVATGLEMSKMKKLLSDLIGENTGFRGFFVNNDTEFVDESVLMSAINTMGKFSFEDFSQKFRVTVGDAKDVVTKLNQEKKVIGTFTLDGKGFITETTLIEEIRRGLGRGG
jgi:hypothetical protein